MYITSRRHLSAVGGGFASSLTVIIPNELFILRNGGGRLGTSNSGLEHLCWDDITVLSLRKAGSFQCS